MCENAQHVDVKYRVDMCLSILSLLTFEILFWTGLVRNMRWRTAICSSGSAQVKIRDPFFVGAGEWIKRPSVHICVLFGAFYPQGTWLRPHKV